MQPGSKYWNWAFLALLAATALILWAAPVFPSQDGPAHLYYVDVLRGVLTHSAPYAQYFRIKSLLTPYVLEYYSLLALELIFPAATSEKVLLCGYVLLFGFGFRYLVESVAERRSPWILVGLPFCMHALVYLGFLNYSFGVALLLFQCGLWIRYAHSLTARRIAILLAGLALMAITHPVPVAVFLVFAGLHWLADVAFETKAFRPRLNTLLLLIFMGIAAAAGQPVYRSFSQSLPPVPSYASVYGPFATIAAELQLHVVAPFTSLAYRAVLMALLALLGLISGLGLSESCS